MDPGIKLLTTEDVKAVIRSRLNEGYTVIVGDPAAVIGVEYSVYPPGTEENSLFECLISPSFPGFGIFLAKKTQNLADFLGNPPDLDKTVCLEFMGLEDDTFLCNQTFAKEGVPIEAAIDKIIAVLVRRG